MASTACSEILLDTSVKAYTNLALDICPYVLLSYDDYVEIMAGTSGTLTFDIDATFFTEVVGYLLLSFVTGHVLGRIAKAFGKV